MEGGWVCAPVALVLLLHFTHVAGQGLQLGVATVPLVTTEQGGTATFTVVGTTMPTADVTVPIESSDSGEGKVSPTSLTFTSTNFNTPQIVTVTGVQDAIDDDGVQYKVTVGPAVSTDPAYQGWTSTVAVRNDDDDVSGATVEPTAVTTTEKGGTATFTVVLNTQPTAEVTIAVSSQDPSEGTVSPTSLVFTPGVTGTGRDHWSTPQTVVVTGLDDTIADGSVTYTVELATATSSDAKYSVVDPQDVLCTNTDDDTAGVSITPLAGLTTTEGGGTSAFSVVLNTQPTADVTITPTSSDTSEGTVPTTPLIFTTANWNTAQLITITGIDDSAKDGDITYTITTTTSSTDGNYLMIPTNPVQVVNTDDDTVGVFVVPAATPLVTTEASGTGTFTIVLRSQPTSQVDIGLVPSDTSEGVVNPDKVSFTTTDWNIPRTVVVTGVDDAVQDGDIPYTIITTLVTTDMGYTGFDPDDVQMLNTDNDVAGFVLNPTMGLVTTEAGGTDVFTVRLNSEPVADVTLDVTSADPTEASVDPAQLVFTKASWATPKSVTLKGVDDSVADGNIGYTVFVTVGSTTDTAYQTVPPRTTSGTNVDDDSAGILVNPATGLQVSEAGTVDTFTVTLQSQPTGDVTIQVRSTDTSEGVVDVNQLVFTPATWGTPRTVTVSGQQDAIDDDSVTFTIELQSPTSTDMSYQVLPARTVSVTCTDDDVAGVTVTRITDRTTEGGGTATFTVVLHTQPISDVVVKLTSSDTTEGTVTPASLTFTSSAVVTGANQWSVPQTVTVKGEDDTIADGDVAYTIITDLTSTDPKYSVINPDDVMLVNVDNDVPGVTITPTAGLITTEVGAGGTTFSVVLNTQPQADVTVNFASNDTSEVTVSPTSITFTAANWNTPVVVTVTGQQDTIDDGAVPFEITSTLLSSDTTYNGRAAPVVRGTNLDDDTADIKVTPLSVTTQEARGTATFTIVLGTEPTADVSVGLTVGDPSEGSLVTPGPIVFTAMNWNTPSTVTILAVDDSIDDGDVQYTISVDPAITSDPRYSGFDPPDVRVTNTDDDTAGILTTPNTLTTTEAGGTATFTVSLATVPEDTVTVPITSGNTGEGVTNPSTLTFTAANWNVPQQVIVTGQDDTIDDGDVSYQIFIGPATSPNDAKYRGQQGPLVTVTNADDDSANIVVNPAMLTTSEAGQQGTFTVKLEAQPSQDVTISLISDDASEGVVEPKELVFTPGAWSSPLVATVKGVQDSIDDGDTNFVIVTTVITNDVKYKGQSAADVAVTNLDDDDVGVSVSPTTMLVTSEAGTTATFTVVLHTQPTSEVTVTVTPTDPTEGTVDPSTLIFLPHACVTGCTPGRNHWSAPQMVTVTGVPDNVDDSDVLYQIRLEPVTSALTDAKYAAFTFPTVDVLNKDDDTAGIEVAQAPGYWNTTVTEGGGHTKFTVRLTSQPSADVQVTVILSDTTEGDPMPPTLDFTQANWNVQQTVMVVGLDDSIDDGNIAFTAVCEGMSTDAGYRGTRSAPVNLINEDDDTAGVTIVRTSPTMGGLLVTDEGGTAASFTIQLDSEPLGSVVLTISSSDTSEGRPNPTMVTLDSTNWNTPQVVTVSGEDDLVDDDDVGYEVQITVGSLDPKYDKLSVPAVGLINRDDDVAGIEATTNIPFETTEGGTTATLTVRLRTEPTADVTVTITSGDPTEGRVVPDSLVFTQTNFGGQTVTLTGLDDKVADGDITYSIYVGGGISSDVKYNSPFSQNVRTVNKDDDVASVVIRNLVGQPLPTPVIVSEGGPVEIFTVALTSEPTAAVSYVLLSRDSSEGRVSPDLITFDRGSWDAPQSVTVTGMQDAVDDDDVAFKVALLLQPTTDTSGYSTLMVPDLDFLNTDDDTAGITVSPTSGLLTSEDGGTATFTVVLHTQPTADVVINLASSDPTEGRVVPEQLTFTSGVCNGVSCNPGRGHWAVQQTVTVIGVQDLESDGNVTFKVTSTLMSGDQKYGALTPEEVAVTNIDDDRPGIVLAPGGGMWNQRTTERGGEVAFTVVLSSRPTANVDVELGTNDTTEAVVKPPIVTFTPQDWNVSKTATAVGVNDFEADGEVAYTLLATGRSGDQRYDGVRSQPVVLSTVDDDVVGVAVNTTTNVPYLVTSEGGGNAQFTIRLTSAPTADVVLPIASSNVLEARVAPSSIRFTPRNWNTSITVSVAGADDAVMDGNVSYTIEIGPANSLDDKYQGHRAAPMQGINTDNDRVGVTVNPTSGLVVTEGGGTATVSVTLTSEPTADVTIRVTSSDHTEGLVHPPRLVFTRTNWSIPQAVTVTGVNDDIDDDDVTFYVITNPAVSLDPLYSGFDPPNAEVTNSDDDDTRGTVCVLPGCTCCSAVTAEDGTRVTFTVSLNTQPTATVEIDVVSTDSSEGVVEPTMLVFTPGSWNAPQTVTVTGQQDAVDDDDVTFTVQLFPARSMDRNFAGLNLPDVSVTNKDDDTFGVTVAPTTLVTNESGTRGEFTVVLHTEPTAEVTIGVVSSDTSEGTLSTARLVFTHTSSPGRVHWGTPQTVTVTPVQDSIADGNISYLVQTLPIVSSDSKYTGFDPDDVSIINADDDVTGIRVHPTSGLMTTEDGGVAFFTVELLSQPGADVTVNVNSGNANEGQVSPLSLVFTPQNWNSPRTVTVTGVNDNIADGDVAYAINILPPMSTDPHYSGLAGRTVAITNIRLGGSPPVTVPPGTPSVSCSTFNAAAAGCQLRPDAASLDCGVACSATRCCVQCSSMASQCPGGTQSIACPSTGCTSSACCAPTTAGVALQVYVDSSCTTPSYTASFSNGDGVCREVSVTTPSGGSTTQFGAALCDSSLNQLIARTGFSSVADCSASVGTAAQLRADATATKVASADVGGCFPASGSVGGGAPGGSYRAVGCGYGTAVPQGRLVGDQDDDSMPAWAIALIVLGCLLCCALAMLLLFLAWRHLRAKPESKNAEPPAQHDLGRPRSNPDLPARTPPRTPPGAAKAGLPPIDGGGQPPAVDPDFQHDYPRDDEYIARWSLSQQRYFYYRADGSTPQGVWDLPDGATVVRWKGGPPSAMSVPQTAVDPYNVTPLPAVTYADSMF